MLFQIFQKTELGVTDFFFFSSFKVSPSKAEAKSDSEDKVGKFPLLSRVAMCFWHGCFFIVWCFL